MNVLVYTGQGTARGPVTHTLSSLRSLLSSTYDVIPIDASTLLTEPWESTCCLLVFPGGRDLPYIQRLSPTGTTRIISYIKSGGSYLGICAGAYFASSRCEFEIGRSEYEVVGERELKFYKGVARGSAFPGFVYDTESGARAVQILIEKENFKSASQSLKSSTEEKEVSEKVYMYHNGGPYFVPNGDVETATVLAWYQPDANNSVRRAAIVEVTVGAGKAVLSGPHIEISGSLYAITHSDNEKLKESVEKLRGDDEVREIWLKSILKRLGLDVGGERIGSDPTPMFFVSEFGGELWSGKCVKDGEKYVLEDFENLIWVADYGTSFESSAGADQNRVPVKIFTSTKPPPSTSTPKFNIENYFKYLHESRSSFSPSETISFGSCIAYGEVMGSTQTLLEKNPKFAGLLPSGAVCVASHQTAGRGRGRNSWVSQSGCLQFSLYVRHVGNTGLIFMQYLVALAVVEAVKSKPGYENLPVCLKWPNDIYARVGTGKEGLKKIGGILVNSSYQNGVFSLVIGVGINVTNTRPTISLNDLIAIHNSDTASTPATQIHQLTVEETLARILVTFERMYRQFNRDCQDGQPFSSFFQDYYRVWLHQDQEVLISESSSPNSEPQYATITGIDNSGMLKAEITSSGPYFGTSVLLQPDGNSFDMMKGLIKRKN